MAQGVVERTESILATRFPSSSSPIKGNAPNSFPLSNITSSSISAIQNSSAYSLDSLLGNTSNKQPPKTPRSERVLKRKEQPETFIGAPQLGLTSTSLEDQKCQHLDARGLKLAPIRTSLPGGGPEQSQNVSKVRKRGSLSSPRAHALEETLSEGVGKSNIQNQQSTPSSCTSAPILPSQLRKWNAEGLRRNLHPRTAQTTSSDSGAEDGSSIRSLGSIASWQDIIDFMNVHENPLYGDLCQTPKVNFQPASSQV